MDGKVDIKGLQANIAYQIESGVEGVLALGTTGESPTLTKEERQAVITTTIETVNRRVPVFVGTGTNATQSTITLTKEAQELGADVALVVTPYYNRPMQEGIYEHFSAICDATDIPICVYNIPTRTSCNIHVETLLRIASLSKVIGVKESSGDLSQCIAIISETSSESKNFTVWGGDDILALPVMSLGGGGVISVASNLIPKEMCAIISAAASGDYPRARERFFHILPLLKTLFIETNPIPIKAAMKMCGMPSGSCRLPLSAMSTKNAEILGNTLKKCGILSS